VTTAIIRAVTIVITRVVTTVIIRAVTIVITRVVMTVVAGVTMTLGAKSANEIVGRDIFTTATRAATATVVTITTRTRVLTTSCKVPSKTRIAWSRPRCQIGATMVITARGRATTTTTTTTRIVAERCKHRQSSRILIV